VSKSTHQHRALTGDATRRTASGGVAAPGSMGKEVEEGSYRRASAGLIFHRVKQIDPVKSAAEAGVLGGR
jgi:hypothetical protein